MVVPVIGLLAVTGALAMVATAPLVLFSSSDKAGPLPSAPVASSEVARVTAPQFKPQRPAGQSSSNGTPETPEKLSADRQLTATPTVGVVGSDTAGNVARRPAARGGGPGVGVPTPTEAEHPGKAKHKSKDNRKGKAKGHAKPNHHGKAKGHSKWQGRSVVAFGPRGAKPSHVGPSRAG